MPATYQTKLYEIHFLYENGYDDAPKIWAHELYKDESGDWNAITEDIADRYDFTEKDIEWLIANWKQSDGSAYTELAEVWFDDFFLSTEPALRDLLPPTAVEWLDNLSEYTYEDESADLDDR